MCEIVPVFPHCIFLQSEHDGTFNSYMRFPDAERERVIMNVGLSMPFYMCAYDCGVDRVCVCAHEYECGFVIALLYVCI